MAQWLKFKRDYDHIWGTNAHTAFAADSVVYVKDEVAERALAQNAAEVADRPVRGDEGSGEG